MSTCLRLRRALRVRIPVRFTVLCVLILAAFVLTGCERSLRQDATRIAQQGDVTAKQLGDYYNALQSDTVDTYRFNTARLYAYQYLVSKLPNGSSVVEPASPASTNDFIMPDNPTPLPALPKSAGVADEVTYQAQYQALEKRVRLAHSLNNLYDAFLHLAAFNASDEVNSRVDALAATVADVGRFSLPDLNSTPTSNSVRPGQLIATTVTNLTGDIETNLTNIRQNHALLRDNARMLIILTDVNNIFNAEEPLYRSIAQDRATASNSLRITLVQGEAVVSTGLYGDILGDGLRWPDPQVPFSDKSLKQMSIGLLKADAHPLTQASANAGDALSRSLHSLVTLQSQFGSNTQLSILEAAQQSRTVQEYLDLLKSKNVPTDGLLQLIQALQKGGNS